MEGAPDVRARLQYLRNRWPACKAHGKAAKQPGRSTAMAINNVRAVLAEDSSP